MTGFPLALNLAWKYLTAPKSHGAVSAISIIAIVGVAVATASIVIVLSVFNGFRHHLGARLDSLTSDISVMPSSGKVIAEADSLADTLLALPEVEIAMPSLTDNALVIANSREMPVLLKGVNFTLYPEITAIDSLLLDGSALNEYSVQDASISVGVAQRLGIYEAGESLLVFAPRRIGRINLANPASSFLSDSLNVSSVFRSMQSEFDDNMVICDITTARDLFQYDNDATSIEIKMTPGYDMGRFAQKLSEFLGSDFIVKDRIKQQEINYRMISVEKWITFLLLAFILLIASFNIISTLCMLIVEQRQSLETLRDLGMNRRRIGNIYFWESLMITAIGAFVGLGIGVILSLLQEKFGFIKLAGDPESLVIHSYPVVLEWVDLAITCAPLLIIGLLCALISRYFAISQVKSIG